MLQGLRKLRDAVNREQADATAAKHTTWRFNVGSLLVIGSVTLVGIYQWSTFLLELALVIAFALDRVHPLWQSAAAHGSVTLRVLACASKRALFAWRDLSSLWGADTVADEWVALLKRMEKPEDMLKFHASDAQIGAINRRRLQHFGYCYSHRRLLKLNYTASESWDWGFVGDIDAMFPAFVDRSAFFAAYLPNFVIGGYIFFWLNPAAHQ